MKPKHTIPHNVIPMAREKLLSKITKLPNARGRSLKTSPSTICADAGTASTQTTWRRYRTAPMSCVERTRQLRTSARPTANGDTSSRQRIPMPSPEGADASSVGD